MWCWAPSRAGSRRTASAHKQSIPSETDPTTWLAIDAVNPIYDNPNFGLPNPATPFLFDSTYTENRHGVYIQDIIDLGEHWKVFTGVRYDHVNTMFDRELAIQGLFDQRVKTDQSFDHGSPRPSGWSISRCRKSCHTT